MSEGFSADWLALREGFDATARSEALAGQLAAVLPTQPRILDLGAGTGSLFRWLAPRIGRAQHWTLADADPELLAGALDEIAGWAGMRGYGVVNSGRDLEVSSSGGIWRVTVRKVDLARTVPLAGQHAVVCSALLDLVSAAWIGALAAQLRVPLLACLSVNGRDAFLPRHAGDSLVRAGFLRDQQHDKGLGLALGRRAPAVLQAALAERGFTLASASTDWCIPVDASAMLSALVRGHAEAAARQMPHRGDAIAAWQEARLGQIGRGELAIRIGHRDSLALPPPR